MKNEEMFHIREDGDLRLVTPSFGAAVANAPWTPDTIQYRSRIETKDGETVSQGFKKFFNLGGGPLELQVRVSDVTMAVERGDAIATLKMDGSLLIRSIYSNDILLRTRGAWGYEHQENAYEINIFREKYPKLFDVRLYGDLSLLFEWTTPTNQIVLRYKEPQLTLIGAISHRDLTYLSMRDLATIAEMLEIPLVEHFNLSSTDDWYRMLEEMKSRQDIEGYVIRLKNEQVLVKVKCNPYLTKHALKSNLTTEKLVDMWLQWKQPSFQEFVKNFQEAFDEEVCMWALPAISCLFDGVREFEAIIKHMHEKAISRYSLPRKEAATMGLAEYGQTKRFALYMNLWEGKPPKDELLKSILLQNTKQMEMGIFDKGDN